MSEMDESTSKPKKTRAVTIRKNLEFTAPQLLLVNLLKEMTIKESAEKLGISRSTANKRLWDIRNKIEKAHKIVNVANNWKGQYKRLGKLLRRQ